MSEPMPQCPICLDDWPLSDPSHYYYPCPCGFQMCAFCLHTLKQTTKKCPQCRNLYDESKAVTKQPPESQQGTSSSFSSSSSSSSAVINGGGGAMGMGQNSSSPAYSSSSARASGQLKERVHSTKPVITHGLSVVAQLPPLPSRDIRGRSPLDYHGMVPQNTSFEPSGSAERGSSAGYKSGQDTSTLPLEELAKMRVVQRNLAYVTGIPRDVPYDKLSSQSMFGQYGKIIKMVERPLDSRGPIHTKAVYVTYATEEAAKRCICAVHKTWFGGQYLRALFGTTKFCSAFLDGRQCTNAECMYLHERNSSQVYFTRTSMNDESFQRETMPILPAHRITFEDHKDQRQQLPPSVVPNTNAAPLPSTTPAPWSRKNSNPGETTTSNSKSSHSSPPPKSSPIPNALQLAAPFSSLSIYLEDLVTFIALPMGNTPSQG